MARQRPDRLLRRPQHQRDRAVDPELAAPRHHRRLGDDDLLEGRALDAGDQMGRPAINTVFNPAADKNLFNQTAPQNADDRRSAASSARTSMNGLKFFSSLDTEGSYSRRAGSRTRGRPDPGRPDLRRKSSLPAPLNGRALADDVIDAELNITTGGDPLGLFGDRDATGAVPGDGVGPHTDYLVVPVPRQPALPQAPRGRSIGSPSHRRPAGRRDARPAQQTGRIPMASIPRPHRTPRQTRRVRVAPPACSSPRSSSSLSRMASARSSTLPAPARTSRRR